MSLGSNLTAHHSQPAAGAASTASLSALTAVKPAALEALAARILAAAGASTDEAAHVARHLVASDMVGHASHGVLRLRQYVEQNPGVRR